jgi:hypothetical protein
VLYPMYLYWPTINFGNIDMSHQYNILRQEKVSN